MAVERAIVGTALAVQSIVTDEWVRAIWAKYGALLESGVPQGAAYWVVNLRTMAPVVFAEPGPSSYQRQQTFTDGQVCPVAFADVRFAVNQFIRR